MSRGRDIFVKYKDFIRFFEKVAAILPKSLRKRYFASIRNKSGLPATAKRYVLARTLMKSVGDNVRINEGCYFYHPENLTLGSNVSIWPMTYIEASGSVTVGSDVSIAHGVTIMSEEHNYSDPDIPIKDQGVSFAPVIIEDNVWIGAKATILAGVTIESGAIIGAGAVVTHNVERNSIVAGVPAREIKKRI